MKIYPSFRYQFAQNRRSAEVYYLVWASIIAVTTVISLIFYDTQGPNSVVTTNGISMATAICVFVLSLNAFKSNFGMALQNGVSRKSLFLGHLCASAALCATLAALDEAVTLITGLIGRLPRVRNEASPLLAAFYDVNGIGPVLLALYAVAFSFFLLLAFSGLGYFVTVLYYRLNAAGKVAVSVAVPCFFILIVPIMKELRDNLHLEALWESMEKAVAQLIKITFGAPWNCMVTCLALFAVFNAFAWLLIRKAALKK